MQEVWKDVVGYEGLYQVSNYGEIVNSKTHKTIKSEVCKGYQRVNLYNKGKYRHHLIHRLVATAFIENEYNHKCINHKDENKINNYFENLEWCNHKYNANYGTRNQRISISKIGKKRKPFTESAKTNIGIAHHKQVNQFDVKNNYIETYESVKEAGTKNSIDNSAITKVCKGKKKTAGGFVWQYA